ncbi:MAG: HIT domain-containing protein [Gammaproteobacteria bacterium]|nr:HIT domain-containing protein [Gammaproteobacteria bacterium]MDH5592079.1 HIT domain-containing protein [Gammaproteobacteria bacterium]
MFKLHSRLAQDTIAIGHFPLCEVLLMNDARYPWIILVPRRDDISEIYQLNEHDQQQLIVESSFVASTLSSLVHADKMNVAAIGNMVPQLHVHHVARYHSDESWPAPVWGKGEALPYSEQESAAVCQQFKIELTPLLQDGN